MRLNRIRTDRAGGNERGAALVEFALILPVLAMITFGMLTAGLAFNRKMDLTHAAREGSRFGATLAVNTCTTGTPCGTATNWQDYVQQIAADRSMGDVSAIDDQVCVALVSGTSGGAVVDGHTTNGNGSRCYPDTSTDSSQRVQVKLTRTGDSINGIFFKYNLTLTSRATARFEG